MPTISAKLALELLNLEPEDLTMAEDRSAPSGLIPPCDCTGCCTCGYCVCNCGNRDGGILIDELEG
ncbi:hypothetical protein [Nocardia colli]|uniref:hypothetical protein n=1 Tax=Nocardia colli TaxID=2545717 RepID=UPI0035DE0254